MYVTKGSLLDATLCKDCDHSCDIINEDPVCFCHEGYALSAVDMKSCVGMLRKLVFNLIFRPIPLASGPKMKHSLVYAAQRVHACANVVSL